MNVMFKVQDRDFIISITEAKRILSNVYEDVDQIYPNGEKIMLSKEDKYEIMKQLHGQIYV